MNTNRKMVDRLRCAIAIGIAAIMFAGMFLTIAFAAVPGPLTKDTIAPLTVRFLDIGDADSAILECDGHYALIDAGLPTRNTDNSPDNYVKTIGITHFDYIFLSHCHTDHILKTTNVIEEYTCDNVLVGSYMQEAYEEIKDAIIKKGGKYTIVSTGDTYLLGDATIEVIYSPKESEIVSQGDHWNYENDSSTILRIKHGEKVFLFTGDALKSEQEVMLKKGINVKCDVMKVPHHGHKNAYLEQFYNMADPSVTIISAGKSKAHAEVKKALNGRSKMYHTWTNGTITVVSDGHNISVL